MIDVVALESNHVVVTVEVDAPVVVAVAGGGVVGFTVDEGVGDGDAVVGLGAQDDVLAADALGLHTLVSFFFTVAGGTYSNVVNPDKVTVVQGDTVTTPDVLGVDVSDGDVPISVSGFRQQGQ